MIVLLDITIQGYSSPNDEKYVLLKYKVHSITECVIQNDQLYEGKTYTNINSLICVTDDEVMIVADNGIKVSFLIAKSEFDKDGGLVFTTYRLPDYKKLIILLDHFENDKYTFSFIDTSKSKCYVYITEFLKQ